MKLLALFSKSLFRKAALASAVLGGFLLFAGAPGAKANAWDDCNRRAAYTEMRYRQAVAHYGPYSTQARHWAHERYAATERCERLRHDWR
ncbi:MAG TPA: hypothetical protein VFB10_11255 [Candidatus Dormibacteraeota bacterium]|nr:hypothetical protein [Candidatus Dormibacteraeota bacterium]